MISFRNVYYFWVKALILCFLILLSPIFQSKPKCYVFFGMPTLFESKPEYFVSFVNYHPSFSQNPNSLFSFWNVSYVLVLNQNTNPFFSFGNVYYFWIKELILCYLMLVSPIFSIKTQILCFLRNDYFIWVESRILCFLC